MYDKYFEKYLAQGTTNGQLGGTKAEVPVSDVPLPVPTYTTPHPGQIASYGVQGLVITIIFYIVKPMLENIYSMLSSKEQKEKDQMDFVQDFVIKQQEHSMAELKEQRTVQHERMVEVFKKLDEQTRVMRNNNLLMRELIKIVGASANNYPRKELPPLDPDEEMLEKRSAEYYRDR